MYYCPSMVLNVFLDQCTVLSRRHEIFYTRSRISRDHRNDFRLDFVRVVVDGGGDDVTTASLQQLIYAKYSTPCHCHRTNYFHSFFTIHVFVFVHSISIHSHLR